MIYVLEDDADRVAKFRATAAAVVPDLPLKIWHDAHAMIYDMTLELEHASVVSLDHDLNPRPGATTDPGTGYDVAKLLEELEPCCPVIIHTSNGDRGRWMEGALTRAGWTYERVCPYGDDWIATEWAAALRRLLGR